MAGKGVSDVVLGLRWRGIRDGGRLSLGAAGVTGLDAQKVEDDLQEEHVWKLKHISLLQEYYQPRLHIQILTSFNAIPMAVLSPPFQ